MTVSIDDTLASRIPAWAVPVILGFFVFLCYGNTLGHQFVYDDVDEMLSRPMIRSLSNFPDFFAKSTYGYYRPIRTLVWALDFSLWGERPFGYHLTNLLLYTIACWAIFGFTAWLVGNRLVAFFCAFLFIAHPLHVESVAWNSGRGDALAAAFLFLSLLCSLKWVCSASPKASDSQNARVWVVSCLPAISAVCLCLSIFSKEFGVVAPLLLGLVRVCFPERFRDHIAQRRFTWVFISSLLLVGLILFIRYQVIDKVGPGKGRIGGSLETTCLFSSYVFWKYIGLLLWPVKLSFDHWVDPRPALSMLTILTLLAHCLPVVLFWLALRRQKQFLAFSIGWFYITYLPVSNIIPLNQLFSEKYMFLPVYSLTLALSLLCLCERRKAFILLLVVILGLYSVRTVTRNSVWKDNFTLFTTTFIQEPSSGLMAYNLGTELEKRGDIRKAIACYRKGIALRPEHSKQYVNLANCLAKENLHNEAIPNYEKAIQMGQMTGDAYSGLALARITTGDVGGAVAALKESLAVEPENARMHYNAYLLYHSIGKMDQAEASFRRACELDLNISKLRIQ